MTKEKLKQQINDDLEEIHYGRIPKSLKNVTLYTLNGMVLLERFLRTETNEVYKFIDSELKKYLENNGCNVVEMFDGNYQLFLN